MTQSSANVQDVVEWIGILGSIVCVVFAMFSLFMIIMNVHSPKFIAIWLVLSGVFVILGETILRLIQ